ncbi:MAG: hypothetical protein OHK0046_47880 [Anaerolineae bacterium]
MAVIKYTQTVEPYESKPKFGAAVISTTVEKEIEFDFNQLDADDKQFWLSLHLTSYQALYSTQTITDYEIQRGGLSYALSDVRSSKWVSESELDLAAAFAVLRQMADKKAALKLEVEALNQEAARRQAEDKAQREAAAEEARQRNEEARRAKLEQVRNIQFNHNGKVIMNVAEAVKLVSELDFDGRYDAWVKLVDRVDTNKTNGYAFEGAFVPNRTVEITNENKLFIVMSRTGSRKYATNTYRVVVLRNGRLEATDVMTDDPSWALVIRDRVAALLDELKADPFSRYINENSEEVFSNDIFAPLRAAVNSDQDTVTVSRELLALLMERADV